MGAKGWIIFSIAAIGALGALIFFSGQNRIDVSEFNLDSIIAAHEKNGEIGDNVFGNKDSRVVLIEYGDFQCPGCAGVNPRVTEIAEKYEDKIAFVFRNLPLTSMHPNARAAAAVAQAAGKQGKYWEMHNMLYEKQSDWSGASSKERGAIFEGYARTLELDINAYNEALASEAITQKINFDLAIAKEKNLKSTPSFSLNGTALDDSVWGDDTKFEEAVLAELKKAGIEIDEESAE